MAKKSKTNKKVKLCSATKNKKWEKAKLEDVTGKIMAQPYIRFT